MNFRFGFWKIADKFEETIKLVSFMNASEATSKLAIGSRVLRNLTNALLGKHHDECAKDILNIVFLLVLYPVLNTYS
jgi:hypothetical protein